MTPFSTRGRLPAMAALSIWPRSTEQVRIDLLCIDPPRMSFGALRSIELLPWSTVLPGAEPPSTSTLPAMRRLTSSAPIWKAHISTATALSLPIPTTSSMSSLSITDDSCKLWTQLCLIVKVYSVVDYAVVAGYLFASCEEQSSRHTMPCASCLEVPKVFSGTSALCMYICTSRVYYIKNLFICITISCTTLSVLLFSLFHMRQLYACSPW